MNRREALRNLAIITGGIILVPSCNFSQEEVLVAYDNLSIKPSQAELLASIADTIIPATDTKGAADISVQDFILVMVNDCMEQDAQETFTQGLNDFESFSKNAGGKAFLKQERGTRERVITQGMSLEDEDNLHISEFLQITKRMTIQGFMASEYMMTEVRPYSLIPGTYNGEVLISNIDKESING
ncbi:gluconate 2-dehydrogenase subunit 3 family protein [Anditalea andensis]|uniref:Twin-arginine translocation pathway signal n=1 Tax=Anditalea andensis TaxID=1048983 RepID=A0A074KTD9_9BACT|nr:gluconate 2-dehydrogenase subunit 3 family protein [Anditalea andensis]KEO72149.1 twin-arginine translocation pathway signal [Anditalea andensis]